MYNKVNQFKWNGKAVQTIVTDEWHRFQKAEGNREPEQRHIHKLMESIKERELFTTIIVNEKWEIIDGQHRKLAFQHLDRPVMVHVVNGLVSDDIRIYNINMHNWTTDHYMDYYITLGVEDYATYKTFKEKTELNHGLCRSLLTGCAAGNRKTGKDGSQANAVNSDTTFHEGELRVTHLAYAYELASMVNDLECKHKKTQSFVGAFQSVVKWFDDNDVIYDHARMVHAFSLYGHMIDRPKNQFEIKQLMQKIYNNRRPNDAVIFISVEEYAKH